MPGPISEAEAIFSPSRYVPFEMPPILIINFRFPVSEKIYWWKSGINGAPRPPSAIFLFLKSEKTLIFVDSAIFLGSPACRLWFSSWDMVCPEKPIPTTSLSFKELFSSKFFTISTLLLVISLLISDISVEVL